MVDSPRVHRLLAEITRRLARLRNHAAVPSDELMGDETRLESTKYLFVTAIEAAIDTAQHVCASEGWGAPDTNADAFRALGRAGLLDRDLAEAMAATSGFRNVLVHGYAAVDDRLVVAALGNLDRLDAFVSSVSAWLLDNEG